MLERGQGLVSLALAPSPVPFSLSVTVLRARRNQGVWKVRVQSLRGIAGLTGIQAELGRNSVLYMRLGSLTQKISSSVSENEEAGVEEEICDEARSLVFVLLTSPVTCLQLTWIRKTDGARWQENHR